VPLFRGAVQKTYVAGGEDQPPLRLQEAWEIVDPKTVRAVRSKAEQKARNSCDRKYGPRYGPPRSYLRGALKTNDFSGCMAERVGLSPPIRSHPTAVERNA
jgi:hypothetical protein